MADKKATTEASTEEPKKHFISMDNQPSLMELNRASYAAQIGAKKRQEGILKRVNELIRGELKRV